MMPTRRVICFTAALLLGAGACKRERPVPPGPGGLPPLPVGEQPAREPGALVHPPTRAAAEAMPPDHPPVLQGAQPVPEPSAVPPDANARIDGVLKIADKVKDKVRPGAIIFLAARAHPQGGPPLATKRLTVRSWPLPFELTSADAMMAGTAFQGRVVIAARVDQDGDAMTKQAGDVEGVSKPIDIGASKVEITLDTLRTQDAGGASPAGLGGGGLPPGHP